MSEKLRKTQVVIDGREHAIYVSRERAVRSGDGKLRAWLFPPIEGVRILPPMKDKGAETLEELTEILGQWSGALANLTFDLI